MMTSQLTHKLEARGLLKRCVDRSDSRARQVRLTQSGRTLLTVALADVETADETHFDALGTQRPAFLAALATLDSRSP